MQEQDDVHNHPPYRNPYQEWRKSVGTGVNHSALPPDLPLGAGLDLHRRQGRHGPGEQLEEHLVGATGDALDVGPRRRVGEQRGVGLEQAPVLEQRAVVAQIESQVAARIHLHRGVHDVPAARRPALAAAEVGRVGGVEGWVGGGVAGAAEAVEAVGEGRAVGEADRVRACSDKIHTCQN